MANIILKNDEIIWKCSNNLLEVIYDVLIKIMNEKQINKNSSIYEFVELLNQNFYGRGCIVVDLNKHFKNKNDISLFSEIFKQSIDMLKEKFSWPQEIYDHSLSFYKKLLEFAN